MEVDEQPSSKTTKSTTKDKIIVDLEEEESINQGGHVALIQEEKYQSITNLEETISQSSLEIKQYTYSDAQSHMFKSKDELVLQYLHKKKQYVEEN